jgi:glycerol kinase
MLMQMQADVLGVSVLRPKNSEATALGAAYLAGLAVGYWPDQESLAKQWQVEETFTPKTTVEERAKKRARWSMALDRVRDWDRQ